MKKKRTKAQLSADLIRTGRPPKPPKERRSERVVLRVTKAEKGRLETQARKMGLTIAAYVLRILMEKGR